MHFHRSSFFPSRLSLFRLSLFFFSSSVSSTFRLLSFPFFLARERVRSRFTREWITAAYFSQLNGQHDIRTDGLSRTAAQHSYQFAGSVRARWSEVGGRAKHPPSCAPIIIALRWPPVESIVARCESRTVPLLPSHRFPASLLSPSICLVRVIFFFPPEISSRLPFQLVHRYYACFNMYTRT